MKRLMYAVDLDTGQVLSRLEGDREIGNLRVAVPLLEYDKIGEGGDFSQPFTYRLERMGVMALIHARLRWTRKVPVETKNIHRRFWGLSELPVRPEEDTVLG